MGVKKSTVSTMAALSEIRYTAASSLVSVPTSAWGSALGFTWRSTCARSAGRILQAQPAPWLRLVSRGVTFPSMPLAVPEVGGGRNSAPAPPGGGRAGGTAARSEDQLEARQD